MTNLKISHCKSCGATIHWVKTHYGKNMPIDAKPEMVMVPEMANPEVFRSTQAWISHFATCPNADKHRRPEE